MCLQHFINILTLALPRSVKIGIWQAHGLDLIGIKLCAKNFQSILKVSRAVGIFAVSFPVPLPNASSLTKAMLKQKNVKRRLITANQIE